MADQDRSWKRRQQPAQSSSATSPGRSSEPSDAQLDRLAVLGDPLRRELYRFVAEQTTPQSRDQVADAVGVARHVAKFHLDKLAAEGLLEVDYRRPPGRTGPGAGRPTKLYSRSSQTVQVQIPPRSYDLAGEIMAEAIDASTRTGTPVAEALRRTAREAGRRLRGADTTAARTAGGQLRAVADVLSHHGFEPRVEAGTLVLANCPFHEVAKTHPAVVCDLNLAMVGGVLESLHANRVRAELEPAEGRCCVTVHRS